MTHPVKQEIGWAVVFRINMQIAGGILVDCYGWVCWQIAASSPEWWAFWSMAYLAYAGGALMILIGVIRAVRLVRDLRRWRKFERLGATPRADRMVQERDFDLGGRMP